MTHDAPSPPTDDERLQLVTSLAALLQDFLVDAQPSAFFSRLLRAVLDLTRSEYGFIAEVHHDADGAPYMRSHALTDIAWDDASRAAYATAIDRGMEFRNLHTLFGAVLVTRDVVISNDPASDPRAGGRPPGHAPMRSFLGLPVHRGGVMVGVVGIANRPGGYGRALCTFLEPVLATCGAAIEARHAHEARREAEQRLRRESARLETLMANLTSGLLLENEQRTVERVNQAFCDMFLIPVAPAALLGADCAQMALGAQHAFRDPAGFLARVEALLAAREPAYGDVLELADGRVFERDFVPLQADGAYRGHYWQYRDVTARVRSEAALVAARDAAEAASRVKTDFLARMSHEIRTPMASVLGYTDLLLHTDCSPDEAIRHARRIRRNAEHLLGLLDDILDVSRIEAGQLTFSSEHVEPACVLAAVDSLLRPLAVERGLTLSVHTPSLPRHITSDGLRFQQILVNLVGNAIKCTDRGGVTVRASVEAADASAWLRVDVEDTGIGMAPDQQAKLFVPFSQVHAPGGARRRGTGLGLAISARLAAGLRGRLELRSEPGAGSTFTLRLPLTAVESTDLAGDAPADSVAPTPSARYAPVSAQRVLVVDDNPDLQLLFGKLLKNLGLTVTFASDGLEAIARVEEARDTGAPFDIVLMDMQMPVMDGYEAVRALRRRGFTTSIVALTAYAMSGDAERCLAAGCDAYLAKPLDFSRLQLMLADPPLRVPA